jgi:hypothetical protein
LKSKFSAKSMWDRITPLARDFIANFVWVSYHVATKL